MALYLIPKIYNKHHPKVSCGDICYLLFGITLLFYFVFFLYTEIVGFNWRLPTFPRDIARNYLLFSDYYGLLSIGGWSGSFEPMENRQYNNNLYYLSFNSLEYYNQDYYEWYWKQRKSMKHPRSNIAAVIIKDNNNNKIKQKLLVIGGDSKKYKFKENEIYDFEQNQWKDIASLNYKRSFSGISYNEQTQIVWLIGGNSKYKNGKIVEYYNIFKNEWYSFPCTHLEHRNYPCVWTDHYLVFVASGTSNGLEYIDIRCDTSWNTVYDPLNKPLSDIFTVHDDIRLDRFLM